MGPRKKKFRCGLPLREKKAERNRGGVFGILEIFLEAPVEERGQELRSGFRETERARGV